MATKKKYDKEKSAGYDGMKNDFSSLAKDIKNEKIPNVILLCGKEQYLVQWCVNEIVKHFVNDATAAIDFTRIDDTRFTLSEIVNACDTVSLLSSKRVVLAENFYYAEGTKKRKKKGEGSDKESDAATTENDLGTSLDSDSEMDALCEYIKTVPDTTILVFTCGIPDMRTKIVKTIGECGRISAMKSLEGAELRRFIMRRLEKAGKGAKSEIIDQIIHLSGYEDKDSEYTLYNLDNDISKIIAHSRSENIRPEDVDAAIAGNSENDIFKLLDAITTGRKDEAYRLMFNNLSAAGSEGGIFGLLALIVKNVENILFVKEMKADGMNLAACQAAMKPLHPYVVQKAWGFSDRFSMQQLKGMCRAVYEIDANVKKGLIGDTLALEMFIANV
ncbi:MAG: DNA polymerase III subunit delta [Firmicutes bacterium]|nr:DNA polymerase III subunit delta [Bacillota bacterium]